jgi:hypothetical protein
MSGQEMMLMNDVLSRERVWGSELDPVPCPKERRKGTGRRQYPKECYWRAGNFALSQPDVTLVHALVGNRVIPMIHAWCELPEGLVYDGVDNEFYRTDEYRNLVGVVAEARYSVQEAAGRFVENKHWGPWEEAEELLRGCYDHASIADTLLHEYVTR